MRQMTGTMLLLSSAVVMAAPWAHAEEKTIQLTEAEQQEMVQQEAAQQETATAQQEAVLQELVQQEIPPQETHHRPQP